MLDKLNALFKRSDAEKKHTETKKCKKCLKRIDLEYAKCSYCGSGDFHFDNN